MGRSQKFGLEARLYMKRTYALSLTIGEMVCEAEKHVTIMIVFPRNLSHEVMSCRMMIGSYQIGAIL